MHFDFDCKSDPKVKAYIVELANSPEYNVGFTYTMDTVDEIDENIKRLGQDEYVSESEFESGKGKGRAN